MKTNKDRESKSGGTATAVSGVHTILLGQDMHAETMVVEVQMDGSMPQPVQRIAVDRYLAWVRKLQEEHPGAKVHAVYEAGPCGYWLHRRLLQQGVYSYVVAPTALNGRRKCDKRDAGALRQQLRDYLAGNRRAFSVVRVPEEEQEQQRALLRHRSALGKALRRSAQQGRSLMLLHGIPMKGSWWGERRWEEVQQTVPAWMVDQLADFVAQARLFHAQIRAAEQKIQALIRAKQVEAPRGIGALTWLTLLLEVGDWSRFNNRREVGSYTGLCGGEWSTGGRRKEGSIDKRGNPRVRHALQEAVWRLLRWQPQYRPLQRIINAKGARARRRAAVAAARRLAIDLWRLATGRTTPAAIHLDAVA